MTIASVVAGKSHVVSEVQSIHINLRETAHASKVASATGSNPFYGLRYDRFIGVICRNNGLPNIVKKYRTAWSGPDILGHFGLDFRALVGTILAIFTRRLGDTVPGFEAFAEDTRPVLVLNFENPPRIIDCVLTRSPV